MDSGPVAFVTGAGSGIGRATALELAARGYRILAVDISPESAVATATAAGGDSLAYALDVRDADAVAAAVERAIADAGRIDLLVNNAGINSPYTTPETPLEVWDDVFAVNVRGTFLCARAIVPHMIERGGGVIVNVASVAGLVGLPQRAGYCASKGAVVSLTRCLALDHVGQGLRVNCVCPGTVDTPWVERLVSASEDGEAAREALVERQPMGRLARPEEVAKAIAYLASEDAAYMTGTALVIDGGWTAR